MALKWLTTEDDVQEPARLLDLWRNAERRAAQGRYDDAVARVYRLLEWSAQWLLRSRCGIDTGNVQAEQIPPGMNLTPNHKGKISVGLRTAWELLAYYQPDSPASGFFLAEQNALIGWLKIRNESILAHGFRPVSENDWHNKTTDWVKTRFLPALLQEMAVVRIRELPPQLPVQSLGVCG